MRKDRSFRDDFPPGRRDWRAFQARAAIAREQRGRSTSPWEESWRILQAAAELTSRAACECARTRVLLGEAVETRV